MTCCGGKVAYCFYEAATGDDGNDGDNDDEDDDDDDENMTRILPMIMKTTMAMEWNKYDDNTCDSNGNSIGDD